MKSPNYYISRISKPVLNRFFGTNIAAFKIDDNFYNINTPLANYAPWLADTLFLKTYEAIKTHTLVDKFRCYELWTLAENIQKIDKEASFMEVGVWRGGTAALVGQKLSNLNSKANFYIADTFEGVAKASDKDNYYKGGEHADTSEEIVSSLIKDRYKHIKILRGIFPEDTQHLIDANEKFGYCHIDVDVYESAQDVVAWIWSKLIVGGVIVFDDYGFHTCTGVTKFVNEQRSLSDRIIVHNLNGHAVIIKIK
jgi:O-methyltransferase